jgi:hypothetical protein
MSAMRNERCAAVERAIVEGNERLAEEERFGAGLDAIATISGAVMEVVVEKLAQQCATNEREAIMALAVSNIWIEARDALLVRIHALAQSQVSDENARMLEACSAALRDLAEAIQLTSQ